MQNLSDQTCEVCRVGAPVVTQEEMEMLLEELPGWEVVKVDGVDHLCRTFTFKNFVEALEFTNRIGEIAEVEGHHPAILTEWGKTTVSWWTHKIDGLHHNDFVMAAKTNEVFG